MAFFWMSSIVVGCLLLALPEISAQSPESKVGGLVNVIELDDQIISPVTKNYIEEAIERSEKENAECLVLIMDTPGGVLTSTQSIVKRIMNADVPIVVYVYPPSAHAASAGVFITMAAHIAAMAPSTRIGAAHPVDLAGGNSPTKQPADPADPTGEQTDQSNNSSEEATDETQSSPMQDKILNDTVAWIRGIAKARGRNEEWAVKAVKESDSILAEEALELNVIDIVAKDLDDLLAQADGRTVEVNGNPVTLSTQNATVVEIPMSKVQLFLSIITHPNIAYILMMLGTLGLIFEFTHPGLGFPGIAGFICLIMALYSFQILPVNYVSLSLLVVGLGMIIAEAFIISHGLLAVGGAICLTLGSLLLYDSPDPALRVSLRIVIPTVATIVGITLLILSRAVKIRTYPFATGYQGMVGETGEAMMDLDPEGTVFIHGENWTAESRKPVKKGDKVRIVQVDGMRLQVEPVNTNIDEKGA